MSDNEDMIKKLKQACKDCEDIDTEGPLGTSNYERQLEAEMTWGPYDQKEMVIKNIEEVITILEEIVRSHNKVYNTMVVCEHCRAFFPCVMNFNNRKSFEMCKISDDYVQTCPKCGKDAHITKEHLIFYERDSILDISEKERKIIVVAAQDSISEDKARASFICDGIDDQIEIQSAINQSIDRDKIVEYTPGEYIVSGPIFPNGTRIGDVKITYPNKYRCPKCGVLFYQVVEGSICILCNTKLEKEISD